MLTTVIIILREFLEAALLISLLSVLHLKFFSKKIWIIATVIVGVIGSFGYAKSFANISEWFDGSGQEVTTGLSLLITGGCLAIQIAYLNALYRRPIHLTAAKNTTLFWVAIVSAAFIIVMAITREGAEIFLYYSTINVQPGNSASMLIGGMIGAGLGVCTGVLSFVVLDQLRLKSFVVTTTLLLALMAAGLNAEAIQLFIQAGWIMSSEAVWDSSSLIPEPSVAGQLLYAIFSYEATPTREEVLAWLASMLSLACLLLWIHNRQGTGEQK